MLRKQHIYVNTCYEKFVKKLKNAKNLLKKWKFQQQKVKYYFYSTTW
jgi:hypothetical protein